MTRVLVVVLGSAVYTKRWRRSARRPLWVFSKNTPPEQRDMRDWDQIRSWAAAIASELTGDHGARGAPARR
jgi:hypothetical protein